MYFNKYTIETNCTKAEIIERLKSLTYTGKIPWFRYNFTEKAFYGRIDEDEFLVTQVIKGRNSFIPSIKGQIVSGERNVIVIKMRLHYITILFIAFLTLLISWYQRKGFEIGGVVFLLFFYGMALYFYLDECKKVKDIFDEEFK